jgi:DNA-directed RNA polymerase alpha subunit
MPEMIHVTKYDYEWIKHKILHHKLYRSYLKDLPIEVLYTHFDLNLKAYKCLKRDSNTIEELLEYEWADFLEIKNFGIKSRINVFLALKDFLE